MLWIVFAVMVAASIAVAVPGTGAQSSYVVVAWLWTAAAFFAFFSAWHGHRRGASVERRFWGYAAITLFFIVCSVGYDSVYSTFIAAGGAVSPSIANLFDTLAAVSFGALIMSLTRFRHASWAARARYWLDLVALALIAIVALETWVVAPWLGAYAKTSVWISGVYSVYPVMGALILMGTLRMVVGMRLNKWQLWERFVAASVSCFAVGLFLQPAWYLDTSFHVAGGWLVAATNVALLSGTYLAGAAAVYRHMYRAVPWRLSPVAQLEPGYGWMSAVLTPSLEVLAIPVFGLVALGAPDPLSRGIRLAVVFALAGVLAARTALTLADNGALRSTAVTDPLTGLLNHRYFHERLRLEIESALKYGEGVSVVMLDLDNFSQVNSSGGHAAGDDALVGIAREIERAVRIPDIVCRIGGDEIAIILPDTEGDAALAVALRSLQRIRTLEGHSGSRLTASAGVASFPSLSSGVEELIKRADGALYWAKFHGKDRAILYDPEVVVTLDLEERIRNLRVQADLEAVRALAAAVDVRDTSLQQTHSRNVAALSVLVAQSLAFEQKHTLLLEFAALLHDVGKIGIPDAIMRKKAPLTRDERLRMEAHSVLGEQILSSTPMQPILPWVRHHHERWDGSGYPDGLSGAGIPLEARIIAVCNAYDAMTSARPYREAMSSAAALQEIDLGLGTQFDPEIGELLITIVGRGRTA